LLTQQLTTPTTAAPSPDPGAAAITALGQRREPEELIMTKRHSLFGLVGTAALSLTVAHPAFALGEDGGSSRGGKPKTTGIHIDGGIGAGSFAGRGIEDDESLYQLTGPTAYGMLTLGYRFKYFLIGLDGMLGAGSPTHKKFCEAHECKSAVARGSLLGRYYFVPGKTFDPWFGIGVGGERHTLVLDDNKIHQGGTSPNLRVGADIWTGRGSFMTASLDYGLGRFDTVGLNTAEAEIPKDNRTNHHWIGLTVGGGFSL
jgi:hypothetical protein